ncbi:hypothetical protein NFI96_008437 [Prochilodus magdalenae]|nr:hypothetical protein NFI96_008437 [Prochilodus magdalenae]
MFREASNYNLDEYTDSVTGFIGKCIEDVVPTKPVRVYPNQKPWLNCLVRAALNARTAAFKSGHTEEYKKASYALRKTIRAAKREYRAKVESQFTTNTRSLWQGLNTITDFRRETRSVDHISAGLPDKLNTFYARFEVNHTVLPERAPATTDSTHHSVSVADVCKAFKRVNIRKAPGPDGIPGRILKLCQHVSNWPPLCQFQIISKCFEKLVRDFICSSLPATLDPMQFAY